MPRQINSGPLASTISLAVTVGSILTLFFLMQLTGRIDWIEKLGRSKAQVAGA